MNPKKILDSLMGKSSGVLNNKNRFFNLFKKSVTKSNKVKEFSGIKSDLSAVFGLVGDFLTGKYKEVSKTSLLLIIGSFLYLLNPMDIVPDFIIGIGFLDDLAIFTYMIKKIQGELDKYKIWKEKQ
ncbi:YkvA family protein [Lagierella sp.]|uniref:YkvA family protein n=1 Tax=Lagierella sp. TaxID=2849657 RepID=UPI002638E70F|nr:YkvA family protein [Lagierella sp.]